MQMSPLTAIMCNIQFNVNLNESAGRINRTVVIQVVLEKYSSYKHIYLGPCINLICTNMIANED